MKKILLAEDEQSIREFVVINLNRAGYEVVEADNGDRALELFLQDKDAFDIAVLDIMMPGMDGLSLCKEIRKLSNSIGILILTAKTQEMDKVTGLMVGADDYVTKPFSPTELVARVDAIYRRVSLNDRAKAEQSARKEDELRQGIFVLNTRNRTLEKNNRQIDLTHVEFQIMELFFRNEDVAFGRTEMLDKVWGEDYFGEEKVVDVNIRRLRKKIESDPSSPKYIVTVWGMGYKWTPNPKKKSEKGRKEREK